MFTCIQQFDSLPTVKIGYKLKVFLLIRESEKIDISGTTIGKGFQGGIIRWNMHRGSMTHGSKSHRAPGSIGMRYSGDGGRVKPGARMPGHLGNKRATVRKILVIEIDKDHNSIVVKGSIPGKSGSILSLTLSNIPSHIL